MHFIYMILFYCSIFMLGWGVGYKEGREDQKEILVRLRKSIANRQS